MAAAVLIEKFPVVEGSMGGLKLSVGIMDKLETVDRVKELTTVGKSEWGPGIHVASYPCPVKNDATNIWAAAVTSGALLLASYLATMLQIKIAEEQYEIAKKYWQMARDRWDFFVNTYIPCEKNEISEIYQGFQSEHCTTGEGSSNAEQITEGIFSGVENELQSIFSAMCICPSPSMIQQVRDGMFTVSGSLQNHGDRFDEKWCDSIEDLWWGRLLTAVSRGRDLISSSEAFSKMSQSLMDSYSGLLGTVASDLSYASNYIRNGGFNRPDMPERDVLTVRDDANSTGGGMRAGYVGGKSRGMYGEYSTENSLGLNGGSNSGFFITGDTYGRTQDDSLLY